MPLVRGPTDKAELVGSILSRPIKTAEYIIRLEDENQRLRDTIANIGKILTGPNRGSR